MAYQSRIPAEETYLLSAGRAFYNYTYLEWGVIWTIAKLSSGGMSDVPKGETAKKIATALIQAIASTEPALPKQLRLDLIKFHERFLEAIKQRNKLLHAHPYTAPGGDQQLGGGGVQWPISAVDEAALFFEETAIFGNAIFHGALKKERP